MRVAGSVIAMLGMVASGCAQDAPDEMGAGEYHSEMRVGRFATMSDDELDRIGQGLCSDFESLSADERKSSVMVLRESTDTDAEAVRVVWAITARWCPQFAEDFDRPR